MIIFKELFLHTWKICDSEHVSGHILRWIREGDSRVTYWAPGARQFSLTNSQTKIRLLYESHWTILRLSVSYLCCWYYMRYIFTFMKHGRHLEAVLVMITATYSRVGGHCLALLQTLIPVIATPHGKLPHKQLEGKLYDDTQACRGNKARAAGRVRWRPPADSLPHHHNTARLRLFTSTLSRRVNISSKQTI